MKKVVKERDAALRQQRSEAKDKTVSDPLTKSTNNKSAAASNSASMAHQTELAQQVDVLTEELQERELAHEKELEQLRAAKASILEKLLNYQEENSILRAAVCCLYM